MNFKNCEVESRVEYFQGDIQETLKKYKTIKKWAYILHDKDDTAPHYHIMLNFGRSSVDGKVIAGWFGLTENQVEKIKGRWTDALEYLTHSNESQKFKHQYDISEVVANFDFATEIKMAKTLGDFETYSYAQQLHYVNTLSVDQKTTAYAKLQKLWKLRCEVLVLNPDRNIDVMFITGKGGCGKTYYAKKLLKSMGLDYCISSSSNDPFQDYLGQNAIILDDLREDAFSLADLLKILDNNTASSIKSRFANKVFNGKLIIITSATPLCQWYTYNYDRDALQQLYRRISCYVVVTERRVEVFNELDYYGRPSGLSSIFFNELAQIKGDLKREKTDYRDVFKKMCEDDLSWTEEGVKSKVL